MHRPSIDSPKPLAPGTDIHRPSSAYLQPWCAHWKWAAFPHPCISRLPRSKQELRNARSFPPASRVTNTSMPISCSTAWPVWMRNFPHGHRDNPRALADPFDFHHKQSLIGVLVRVHSSVPEPLDSRQGVNPIRHWRISLPSLQHSSTAKRCTTRIKMAPFCPFTRSAMMLVGC